MSRIIRSLVAVAVVSLAVAAGNATPRFVPFTLDWSRALDGEAFIHFGTPERSVPAHAANGAAHLSALAEALAALHADHARLASDIATQERILQILVARSDPADAIEADLIRLRARASVLADRIARATALRDRLQALLASRSEDLSPALRAADAFLLTAGHTKTAR